VEFQLPENAEPEDNFPADSVSFAVEINFLSCLCNAKLQADQHPSCGCCDMSLLSTAFTVQEKNFGGVSASRNVEPEDNSRLGIR
jgi:hypothetical protein